MTAAFRRWWAAERGPHDFGDYFAHCLYYATGFVIVFALFLFSQAAVAHDHHTRAATNVCVGNWDCQAGTYRYGEAGAWLTER